MLKFSRLNQPPFTSKNSSKQIWWWILMWKDNSGQTFSPRGRVIIFYGLVIWPEATFISFIAISVNWTLLFCSGLLCLLQCNMNWWEHINVLLHVTGSQDFTWGQSYSICYYDAHVCDADACTSFPNMFWYPVLLWLMQCYLILYAC